MRKKILLNEKLNNNKTDYKLQHKSLNQSSLIVIIWYRRQPYVLLP